MKLELKNVKKQFGQVRALDGLSISFEPGIYGILGPNGAGKSTMINLITDNLKRDKDGGEILYNGEDILKLGKSFRSKVGYMPQQQGFYDHLSAKAFLQYMASVKEIPKKEAAKQIDELLDVVGLKEKCHLKVGGFSGGMKQRILLAQALLGRPEILILDEPTAGLDPKERINLRNFITKLSENKIILIATHVVSDIECIAGDVMILSKGKLVANEHPIELCKPLEGCVAEVPCEYKDIDDFKEKYAVGNLRQDKDGLFVRIVKRHGEEAVAFPDSARLIDDINLEDVYLHYFGN